MLDDKLDLRRLDAYRARAGAFREVEVPPLAALQIDGRGDPNVEVAYREAVEALFALAYRIKFATRARTGRDFVVMPLEGLWWADDPVVFTTARDKAAWSWTMLVVQPEWITQADLAEARSAAGRARVDEVRLATLDEGRCIQTLHVGSFDDEGPMLARMHDEIIPGRGLRMTGPHHEIYLSDPRRTASARLRTILRQPVEPAG